MGTKTTRVPGTAAPPTKGAHRWLLLVHQLPARPSNLRVRTWRRLQQLGALPIKQAVYVLPDSAEAREDFEWLKTEIQAAGGEASVFAADHVDAWSDDALVEEFRRSRQRAYAALARELERGLGRRPARAQRRIATAALRRRLGPLRRRLAAIEAIDFFGSPGRERVVTLLERTEALAAPASGGMPASAGGKPAADRLRKRLWVTRPRPGVDRMASAWLIRRFIDPQARFGFAPDPAAVPAGAVPFDMFGVDFGHHGGACTFETLCAVFEIDDPTIARIAAIVHDLDLKDGRFGASEAPALALLIDGLRLTHDQDDALLDQGMALFEWLYRALEQAGRPARSRAASASPARSRHSPGRA
jgi:hypothetical protein